MLFRLIAAATLAAAPSLACAQSSPNWSRGYVPSAGEINNAFAKKQDKLQYTPLSQSGGTMTGKLQAAPATINGAGLSILPGVAPTAPSNGDLWSTGVGLFGRFANRTLAIPGMDQSTGALAVPGGPTLGTYQNGKFTSQPDALQIQGAGSTGDGSSFCVKILGSSVCNYLSVRLGWTVYVTDFMPPGSTDITTALQTAVSKLWLWGGKVIIPAADTCYTMTAPLTVTRSGVTILGDGRLGSCIQTNFQGDVITAGTGDTINNFVARDISFRSSVARTSGAAVNLVNTYNSTVADISCDTNPYICVDVKGPASSSVAGGPNSYNIKLHRIHTTSPTYVGIRVGYGNTTGLCPADVHIDTPNLGPSTRAGIEIQCSGGFQIVSGDAIASGVGLLIDPGDNQQVAAGITTGIYLDTSVNAGIKIAPTGTGQVADSTFASVWVASNGQSTGAPGVLVQGTTASVRSISFNAPRIVNNGGEGIRIEGGAFIDIAAPQIAFNGLKTLNTYSGLYIGAGVSNVSVSGGRIGAGSSFVQPTYHKYGIEIAAGSGDYLLVSGTDLSGNQTGPISNGATGTHQLIMPLGGDAGIVGGNFGVGTVKPFSPLSVAGPAHAYSDAQFGLGTFQMSTGAGGQFDMSLLGGVNDAAGAQHTWLQSSKPGTGNYPLYLNPNGGSVMLGRPSPPTTNAGDYLPYIPVMAGTPTVAPTAVTGMTPIVIDGTNNKICFYTNSAWRCVGP